MSRSPLLAAALVSAAAVSFASTASAYCRTVTVPLPASYDPSAGCFSEQVGTLIPLWWSNACVGWSVQQDASKQLSYQDAVTQVGLAFGRWEAVTCPAGGSPSITASDNGPVACDQVEYSEVGPNQHEIIFRDSDWPHDDPYNTLALTTVTFDTDTGEIYDADVEVNTSQNQIVAAEPVPAGAYDFASIITHESGHFLGLAHTPLTTAVMYYAYSPGSTVLTTDDIDGICSIYPSNGTRVTSFAGATQAEATCDATPRHGFGSACGSTEIPETTSSGGCDVAPRPTGHGSGLGWALGAIAAAGAIARRRGARLLRMKRPRALVLVAALGVAASGLATLSFATDAHANVSIAVTLDELARDSSAVAVVTPVEQRSVWSGGRIYTFTRVQVGQSVAGSVDAASDGSFWVRTMGGAVDHVGQLVEGEAVLEVGKSAMLFVTPLASEGRGVYTVTARGQGQFPVVRSQDGTHDEVIHSSAAGMLMPPPAARMAALAQARARVGVTTAPPLAADALHHRAVSDAAADVASAWARLHAAP